MGWGTAAAVGAGTRSGLGNEQQFSGFHARSTLATAGPAGSTGNDGNAHIPQRARGRIAWSVTLVFQATLTPVNVPAYRVPHGAVVRVRHNNGLLVSNTGMVYASTDYRHLVDGHGTPLAPLDDIVFPVDNTALLWVMGVALDGVTISVVTQE